MTLSESIFKHIKNLLNQDPDALPADLPEYRLNQLQERREAFERAQAAVKTLVDITNRYSGDALVRSAVVAGVVDGHRFLQQQALVEILEGLGDLGGLFAESPSRWSDARNEHALRLCLRLRETFKEELFWKDAR